ncbi:MAG: hypothetical protein LUD02_13445 [Tannerellaceae bacterium]|nr:hypothetical protein [Tannerellaceae bacterium]
MKPLQGFSVDYLLTQSTVGYVHSTLGYWLRPIYDCFTPLQGIAVNSTLGLFSQP